MLDEILAAQPNQLPFSIVAQRDRINNLNLEFPTVFNTINTLSRNDVVNIILSDEYTNREKLFAILFWGIYFEVAQKSPKMIFLHWINLEGSDLEIQRRFDIIIEADSPSKLFRQFQRELKIPGLDYAYFTKIFYFVRKSFDMPIYPILDKWLMCAFTAISAEMNGDLNVFNKYMSRTNHELIFDGIIRRQKPQCYEDYVNFMSVISMERNIFIDELEEKLFGIDRSQDQTLNNPRIKYLSWAVTNGLKA
jgi:hypothetical protein